MSDSVTRGQYEQVQREEHYSKQKIPSPVIQEIEPRSSQDSGRPKQFYRPSIIRAPAILTLLVVVLALIGCIEYACRSNPTESLDDYLSLSVGGVSLSVRNAPLAPRTSLSQLRSTGAASDHNKRENVVLPSGSHTSFSAQTIGETQAVSNSKSSSTSVFDPPSTMAKEKYLPPTTHQVVSSVIKTDAYLPTDVTSLGDKATQPSSPTGSPTVTGGSGSPSVSTTSIGGYLPKGVTSLSKTATQPLSSFARTSDYLPPTVTSLGEKETQIRSSTISTDKYLPSGVTSLSKTATQPLSSITTSAIKMDAYLPPETKPAPSYAITSLYLPSGVTSLDKPTQPNPGRISQPTQGGDVGTITQDGNKDPNGATRESLSFFMPSTNANGYLQSGVTSLEKGPTPYTDVRQTTVKAEVVSTPGATGPLSTTSPSAQSLDSEALKAAASNSGTPVASLRPGSPYITTDAQGSTMIAFAGVTNYIVRTSTDAQGRAHTNVFAQGVLITKTTTDATGGLHTVTQTAEATRPAATSGPNRINRPVRVLTNWGFFVSFYLPIIIAILLRITVGMVYAAVKMLEPFITLHSNQGVLAKDFLNINYLATSDKFDPFVALFTGHWFMLFTTALYTVVGLLTPFASEFARFYYFCNSEAVCGPEMRVKPTIGRVLQGLLGVTAVMLIAFLLIERRYRSGIFADPSSIATMATLLHQPQVVKDFQEMDPDISKEDMEHMLFGKRYCLDYYEHKGAERYGLVAMQHGPMSVTGDKYAQLTHSESRRTVSSVEQQRRRRSNHYVYRFVRECFLGILTAGILVTIVWYYKNSDQNNSFEKFMDSQSFGPRFVFSIFGMLLQGQWTRLERETNIIQPFRTLAASGQTGVPASRSILTPRTLNHVTSFLVSLPRGHIYCALVALTSLLSEILILTLAGIPFNSGQLFVAFLASARISMAILGVMLLVQAAIYLRPRGPALPRTPNTPGAVWSYLCASAGLVEDFADLSTLDEKTLRVRVGDMGRRYAFAVAEDSEGSARARWQVRPVEGGSQSA